MTTRLVLLWIAAFASRTPAQFTTAGNMITPRAAHTATLLRNGKVLITGGLSKGNPPGPRWYREHAVPAYMRTRPAKRPSFR